MAKREITGASQSELEELKEEYFETPQYKNHAIPFDVAYCLQEIANQPDHYDGPQRYCKRRVSKKDPDNYEGESTDKAAYTIRCVNHGASLEKLEKRNKEGLEPYTARITHSAYAEDEHLIMDFTDDEQNLYDSIMEDWPEIYDWPPESEDPARYRILRRVAVNEVRAQREEDYLDNHEVHEEAVYDENGVQVGSKDVENPLAREYRLLMSEVTNQMKELGLTPKERQKMDTLESEKGANEAVTEIASDALDGDAEYDPEQFNDE